MHSLTNHSLFSVTTCWSITNEVSKDLFIKRNKGEMNCCQKLE